MTVHAENIELARQVIDACRVRNIMIAAAESCTGGLIATTLTEIPGSSAVFDRGFVTYSNTSKIEMLGIFPITIKQYGAVSKETAMEMAHGALARSEAGLSIACTGIAGPMAARPTNPSASSTLPPSTITAHCSIATCTTAKLAARRCALRQ